MGLADRSFVEYLINKIKKEGIYGSGYSDSERESDVIDMIWDAYYEFFKTR
jgi:hypothetical protein